MARGGARPNSGGARPGAGRPKKQHTQIEDAPPAAALAPIEYMLAVMRDPTADPARRDRMAQAVAPYLHERVGTKEAAGKKVSTEQLALIADDGTAWEGLLQ